MRPERTRTVRRALVVVLVGVTGAVLWSLRRPGKPPATPAPAAGAAQGTTLGDVSLLRFREGSRQIEVKARAMSGRQGAAVQLEGVEVKLPYVSGERKETATITADRCLYEAERERASFRGNVKVVTSDGFELESPSLDYRGDEGTVKSPDEVRFRKGRASGSGRGLEYHRAGGIVELHENVHFHIEAETGPPTEIEAASGRLVRSERRARLLGGVGVRQGGRELHSQELRLQLSPDLEEIERATAIHDVDLRLGEGETMPGGVEPEGGEKRLRCRKLHVVLRPGGVLAQAFALKGATLDVLPGRHDPQEKRRLASRVLQFAFDEQGRLVRLVARAGYNTGRRTTLVSEPLGPGQGREPWQSEGRMLVALFDPASGEVRSGDFEGGFVFEEPERKAWARRATFDAAASRLTLTGDARVQDEAQRSELRAARIELDTHSHAMHAQGGVRHTLQRSVKGKSLLGREEPAVIASSLFDYDPGTKTAHYREGAVLRSGLDEVRAPTIVLEEPAEGRRRLTASGGVTSILVPRKEQGQAKETGKQATQKETPKEKAPIETRSRDMVYEEEKGRIVYTGEVRIQQGDITTSSPEAIVTLTEDGGDVERVNAGSPAEVRQGARVATGERGTYTAKDETLVLVGEKVELKDVDRRIIGRILVFQVGSDRILVDGREETRTEAIFKRKEPPKP
jgi:lipopolysaccharide transport protein LptA/LPS export ABC transporter protein LptC